MRDKADLTDRYERLEHIVMQLQGETDTIGESVSLSVCVSFCQWVSQLVRSLEFIMKAARC